MGWLPWLMPMMMLKQSWLTFMTMPAAARGTASP